MHTLLVGFYLCCLMCCHALHSDREPRCSKFDFEEKVLEKMVRLEHSTELMMKSISEVSAKVDADIVKMTDITNKVKEDLAEIQTKVNQKGANSIYVRWGRTVCSGNYTELIYKGYIAGGQYNKGGGANIICLPEEPTWGNYELSLESYARVYGTEIDILNRVSTKLFGKDMGQQDLPCVVCQTHYSLTHLFPGRFTCFPGWSLQYAGYLVTDHYGHSSNKNYECLDSAPETIPRGDTNDDQCVLYVVEAKCGSLPCPPYVEGREVACAVCSK